jgi:predicted PurR-regulated permease PerM
MSIIPIFGSILSTVPAVLVALPQGFGVALLVLGWIIGVHQIEANLLNPKIMGDSARVHPVLVVFALLAGEHFAGLVGALLAVPVLSITQTLFLYLRERYLGVPRGSSFPPPVPKIPEPTPPEGAPAAVDPTRP